MLSNGETKRNDGSSTENIQGATGNVKFEGRAKFEDKILE